MGEEYRSADQTHDCCNRLEHRKTSFAPRTNQTTRKPAQSKGFTGGVSHSDVSGDSAQQVFQKGAAAWGSD